MKLVVKALGVTEAVAERQVRVVVSTGTRDRVRDIVEPKGGEFAKFLKSQTVLFNHNQDVAIAKCLETAAQRSARPQHVAANAVCARMLRSRRCRTGALLAVASGAPLQQRQHARAEKENDFSPSLLIQIFRRGRFPWSFAFTRAHTALAARQQPP